jgi:hypothetical protein
MRLLVALFFKALWLLVSYPFPSERSDIGSIFFRTTRSFGNAGDSAEKIGLIRTMVFTHLPSNILFDTCSSCQFQLAIAMLLRFSISQMDVLPVRPIPWLWLILTSDPLLQDNRIARSVGAALSPAVATSAFRVYGESVYNRRRVKNCLT